MTINSWRDIAFKTTGALTVAAVLGAWGYVIDVRADVDALDATLSRDHAVLDVRLTQIAKDLEEIKLDVKELRSEAPLPATSNGRLDDLEESIGRIECVTVGMNNPDSPFCRRLK